MAEIVLQVEGVLSVDEVMGNLDLLIQILILLPVVSLARFKSVSKLWHSLISDRGFLENYTRHLARARPLSSFSDFYYQDFSLWRKSSEVIQISLHGYHETIPKMDIGLEGINRNAFSYPEVVVQSYANGLFLCQQGKYIFLYNPITKKRRVLPDLPRHCQCRPGYVLAFDPSKSIHYKVVNGLRNNYPFDHPGLEVDLDNWINIFSSESGLWNIIRLEVPLHAAFSWTKLVFWNGGIHWINLENIHLRFGVDDETLTWSPIPTDPNISPENVSIGYLGEGDSGLLVIKFSRGEHSPTFGACTILEMTKESKCWTPKYHVDLRMFLSELPRMDPPTYDVLYVISKAGNGNFSLVLGTPGNIILYSVENNNHTETRIIRELPQYSPHSYSYFQPLIPWLVPL